MLCDQKMKKKPAIWRGRRVFIIDVLLPAYSSKTTYQSARHSASLPNTPRTDPSSVSGIPPSQQVSPCPTSPRLGPPYTEPPRISGFGGVAHDVMWLWLAARDFLHFGFRLGGVPIPIF